MSHTPRPADGRNSMNMLYATGTPPSPNPTRHRANSNTPKDCEKAEESPATNVSAEC